MYATVAERKANAPEYAEALLAMLIEMAVEGADDSALDVAIASTYVDECLDDDEAFEEAIECARSAIRSKAWDVALAFMLEAHELVRTEAHLDACEEVDRMLDDHRDNIDL